MKQMRFKGHSRKLSDINTEWIKLIPKTINKNGCWIPNNIPSSNGYVRFQIEGKQYLLHRISMCLFYNIDYYDYNIETRHSKGCSKSCFNPEHLKPGSHSDNLKDAVLHKTNYQSKKECCSKCGKNYKFRINRSGDRKGHITRHCPNCKRQREELNMNNE